jgi:hypothetical protein
MAIRSTVCAFSLFILVSLSAGQILLAPSTLEYGSVESNNGVNMTTYKIHLNASTTSYQIQFIRMTPVDSDSSAKFYVAYNSTVFNTQTLTGYRTTYTISRYDSMGDYFIGIYANNVNYTYAIQYCPGTCSTSEVCPSLCSGQGGCNMTSLTCACDDTIYRWTGADCSVSQAAEDGTKILGMTIAVFVVVVIILILVCVALPIILIFVCCCGVCVAAGVAANDGPRTREYRIIQTQEHSPLLHGQVVYKV